MMEGKAYYRAVRAHIWTFKHETLCPIEKVFTKAKSHTFNQDVFDAVSEMIYVLQLPALQEFSYWLTYMEMVETLLDFPKSQS